jgi:predicted HTH domain antitoxin
MRTIAVDVPDDLAEHLHLDEAQLAQEIRWLIAVKLYELGRVSAGVAAEIVGVSRVEFLNRLAEFCVSPINLDEDALAQEFQTARAIAHK